MENRLSLCENNLSITNLPKKERKRLVYNKIDFELFFHFLKCAIAEWVWEEAIICFKKNEEMGILFIIFDHFITHMSNRNVKLHMWRSNSYLITQQMQENVFP